MSHKDTAVTFLQLLLAGRIREAFEAHVGPGFRHHDPLCRGDAVALVTSLERNEAHFPGKALHIQRALQDGDLVAVHARVGLGHGESEFAVVHLLRFEGERIAELWIVEQPVLQSSPNQNGMF